MHKFYETLENMLDKGCTVTGKRRSTGELHHIAHCGYCNSVWSILIAMDHYYMGKTWSVQVEGIL